jgi:hypothetical protein
MICHLAQVTAMSGRGAAALAAEVAEAASATEGPTVAEAAAAAEVEAGVRVRRKLLALVLCM